MLEEPLKYSAEDDGDSSGVSIRGRVTALIMKPIGFSFDGFVGFSLGGVGGRAMVGTSPVAKPTMVNSS